LSPPLFLFGFATKGEIFEEYCICLGIFTSKSVPNQTIKTLKYADIDEICMKKPESDCSITRVRKLRNHKLWPWRHLAAEAQTANCLHAVAPLVWADAARWRQSLVLGFLSFSYPIVYTWCSRDTRLRRLDRQRPCLPRRSLLLSSCLK